MTREELLTNDSMIGQKFGMLQVVSLEGRDKHRCKLYRCFCDCGNEKIVSGVCLRSGHTKSCGCKRQNYYQSGKQKTHGLSNTKLYRVWASMKFRCCDKNNKDYGGRGITICAEWMNFETFYAWSMENGYKEGLEIDRIDVNGNYEPDNCRWITRKENNNNQRRTVIICVNNISRSITQWAEYLGIHPATIRSYVNLHKISYEEYIKRRMEGKIYGQKKFITSK